MTILATIGYEASSSEDFVATLLEAGVKTLIDVRQVAMSRRKGFSKKALQESVEKAGISYVHLVGLGDPKEGRDAAKAGNYDKFLQVYTAHMKTSVFKSDLEEAVDISKGGDTCLMCYERLYQECHRKLLADKISTIVGADVSHLGVREGIAKNGYKVRKRTRAYARQSIAACG